jgi:hypothetical protein
VGGTRGGYAPDDPGGIFCTPRTHAGSFAQATWTSITDNGVAVGAVGAGVPASGTLASVFCLAATGNGIVDSAADLPGPGAVSLPGMFVVNERSQNALRMRRPQGSRPALAAAQSQRRNSSCLAPATPSR